MTTAPASPSPADGQVTLPQGLPELTLGWEVVRWATKYLRHPNGPRARQRWEFVDSQIRFLLWWYAVDEDGQWLFNRAVRRLAKGSGKSPFAGLYALGELCAPVRLADFDASVPGGCVGRAVDMPLVEIAATAQSQTKNTMRMVRAFAPKDSRIVADFGLDPGLERYYRAPEGELRVITSSAAAAEGAEATAVVGDETEHWHGSNGGTDLAATLLDNLAKSGNRMMQTENAWVPGAGSVAEATYEAWLAQQEGRQRGRARILYDARIAPADTDLADADSLRRGLAFAYGDCWWQTRHLGAVMDRIWSRDSRPDDSRRKYLNQPTAAEDAWTTPMAWAALADPSRAVVDGEDVALFFDGSKSRDATALVACAISDGHVITLGVWEPDPAHDSDDVVDVADVDLAVGRAFARFHVRAFLADVKEWEGFTKVTWPDRYGADLDVWAVPGGKDPQVIAWDMRSHAYEFGVAAELTEAEITDRTFTHDGDSRLARHVGNARRRPARGVVSIGKESPDSPKKIDAAVCMIGARMARRLVLAAGPAQGPRTNVARFL